MQKCRITVLLYAASQGKTCFNPLVVVDNTSTIADVVKKALALYAKKVKSSSRELEVLALHTINAGVTSTIADDDDQVMDILGVESTLTVVVKDAVNLADPLMSTTEQLITPGPSTSPSLDLNILQHNLAASSFAHFDTELPVHLAKKRKLLRRALSPESSPGYVPGRNRISNKRERRRAQKKQAMAPLVSSPLPVKRQFPTSESGEDDFKFTRPATTRAIKTALQCSETPATFPVPANLDSKEYSKQDEELAEDAAPQVSKSVASEIRGNCTSPSTDTSPGIPQRRSQSKESSGVQRIPGTVGSQAEQVRIHSNQAENEQGNSTPPLTESNLQLAQQQLSPQPQVTKSDVISVMSSSIHSSHILGLERRDVEGGGEEEEEEAVSQRSNPSEGLKEQKTMVDTSESVASESDATMESDLLNYLSPAESQTASTPVKQPRAMSIVSESHSNSSDSSSMKSGTHASQNSTEEEVEAEASEAEQESGQYKVSSQPATFQETARSSPEASQVTDPAVELEAENKEASPPEAVSQKQRYQPMRPGLRTIYRPLSFLHEQSLREKDDLSKIAQSPSKLAHPQMVPDSQNEPGSERDSDEAEEGDTDDTTSSDSDDHDNNNVPPEKRARASKKPSKKRQSQGARGLLDL